MKAEDFKPGDILKYIANSGANLNALYLLTSNGKTVVASFNEIELIPLAQKRNKGVLKRNMLTALNSTYGANNGNLDDYRDLSVREQAFIDSKVLSPTCDHKTFPAAALVKYDNHKVKL